MKPKVILCLALVSTVVILGLCYSYTYLSAFLADYGPNYNPSALEVTMEIPAVQLPGQTSPTFNTLYNQQARDPEAHFHVKIKNVSSQPVFIWDASTLEADCALSFEITEAYIWTFRVEKAAIIRDAGNPHALHLLAPGETQVREMQIRRGVKQQQRDGQENEAELAGIEEHGAFLTRRNVEKPGGSGEAFWVESSTAASPSPDR